MKPAPVLLVHGIRSSCSMWRTVRERLDELGVPNEAIDLPESWTQFAPLADDPFTVSIEDINSHRDEWIEQWTQTVIG